MSYVPAVVVHSIEDHPDFLTLFEAENENPNQLFKFSADEDAKLMEGSDVRSWFVLQLILIHF